MQKELNTELFKQAFVKSDISEVLHEPMIPIYENTVKDAVYSISITVYKRAEFLIQCIESALAQDTKIKYQVIIIDDNPARDDEVEKLLMRYCENEKVSYYKKKENEGLIISMSRAILTPSTDWNIMLHDDDYLHNNYLSVIDKYRKLHPDYKIICPSHDTLMFGEQTQTKARWKEWISTLKGSWPITLSDFIFGTCATPTGTLFYKPAFLDVGGFNPTYGMAADYVFFAKFVCYYRVLRINEKLFTYRWANNESLNPATQENARIVGHYMAQQVLSILWKEKCKRLRNKILAAHDERNNYSIIKNKRVSIFDRMLLSVVGVWYDLLKFVRRV